jgi:hypothetical protein
MTQAKKDPIQVIQTSKAGPPVVPISRVQGGRFIFVPGKRGWIL